MARMDVIHEPSRVGAGTYDAWMRSAKDPR
jgi:hypothetical protein